MLPPTRESSCRPLAFHRAALPSREDLVVHLPDVVEECVPEFKRLAEERRHGRAEYIRRLRERGPLALLVVAMVLVAAVSAVVRRAAMRAVVVVARATADELPLALAAVFPVSRGQSLVVE